MLLPRGSQMVRNDRCEVSSGLRPGEDASPWGARKSGDQTIADLHSNSVPSAQIACSIAASLRATATWAFFSPAR